MASVNRSAKRQLYKPAAGRSVSLEQKPRTLAQGILAESSTSWQEELSRSTSEFYSDDVIATSHKRKDRPKPKFPHDEKVDSTDEESSSHQDRASDAKQWQESGVVEDLSTLHNPNAYRKEILIVDASGPSLNPDTSEVSTTVRKVFSPVKVICHSPSPEKQKQNYEVSDIKGKYDVKVESPRQIILGSKTMVPQNDTNEDAVYDQESTEKSSTLETKQQDAKQKKKLKKPPRVIQSRYMIPKDAKKKQDDDVSKNKPTTHSFIHDISAIPPHSIIEGPMGGQGAKKKKAKVTSTPFNPSSWSEKTRMIADDSYLEVSKNVPTGTPSVINKAVPQGSKVPHEKHTITKGGHGISGAGDSGIGMAIQEQEEPVTEKQLTMKYCRMLQAMFLNAKSKNTFARQEEEAKQQIYNVWQENQRLKGEIRQLEQICLVKKHAMILDQLLKVQDAGLKPIDESLDKLHSNYLTMGEALDTTRHFMPVEDIIVGDEEKLISALKESQMLLAEISSHTSLKEPGIEQLATDLSHIVDKFHTEITEQTRCEELLIAANSLANHERSLQSQLLQSKPISM